MPMLPGAHLIEDEVRDTATAIPSAMATATATAMATATATATATKALGYGQGYCERPDPSLSYSLNRDDIPVLLGGALSQLRKSRYFGPTRKEASSYYG